MQDVFEEGPKADQPGESQTTEQPQGAEQGQQQPAQAAEQQPAGEAAASPAATEQGKHVPLEALEAERKGRQDWKERAIRYEEELKQLRQQVQQPAQQPQQDPVVAYQQRLETVLLNASERAVRKELGDEVVNKAFARMQQEFAKNPALHQQVLANPDPWRETVTQGQRLMAMDEIGSDPSAYRAKLEAEIRASLSAAPAAPAAPAVPQSLAGARSAGARGTTFTGPTPMETIFPN